MINNYRVNMMRLANAQKNVVFVGAITDLNVTAFNDDSITLDWTTPSSDNPIDYYEVYLDGVFHENTTDATAGWTITDLLAGTSYNITLKTVDEVGNKSVFSNEVLQSTSALYIYDTATVYALRRPAMTTLWTNAVLKIRRSSDDNTAFVFFDGSGVNATISTSSFISTSSDTTPSATTLGTWLGANDAFVETWFGITDNNTIDTGKRAIQATTTKQPKFATAGAIITKNGKPTIDFLNSTRYLEASANSAFTDGNSFTVLSVSNNIASNNRAHIFNTNQAGGNYFTALNDMGTGKYIGWIKATTTAAQPQNATQQNTSNQKVATLTADGTAKQLSGYYNGTFQEAKIWAGTYSNGSLTIGTGSLAGSGALNGTIQEIVIFPSDKTSDLATLHADINAYYSIY
jgi:hypothetical protein